MSRSNYFGAILHSPVYKEAHATTPCIGHCMGIVPVVAGDTVGVNLWDAGKGSIQSWNTNRDTVSVRCHFLESHAHTGRT